MRTTLTLDDDVVARLQRRCRREGKSFKAVVNETLREGLSLEQAAADLTPFHVEARPLRARPGVHLDNVAELLEQLDGPAAP